MTIFFVDASALAKRYLVEVGTPWVRGITDRAAGNVILISEISRVEVAAALGSRHRGGTITQQERESAFRLLVLHATQEYQRLAFEPLVADRAMLLTQRYRLRGYDAEQPATALAAADSARAIGLPPPIFVSADSDLLAAAQAEGLPVDDPKAHQ